MSEPSVENICIECGANVQAATRRCHLCGGGTVYDEQVIRRRVAAAGYLMPLIPVLGFLTSSRQDALRFTYVQSLLLYVLLIADATFSDFFLPAHGGAVVAFVSNFAILIYLACFYCFLQTWRGREAHIPLLSSLAKICCAPRAGADTFAK